MDLSRRNPKYKPLENESPERDLHGTNLMSSALFVRWKFRESPGNKPPESEPPLYNRRE
jgi:hypothetical protein